MCHLNESDGLMSKIAKIAFGFLACGIMLAHLSNIWRLQTYPFTDLPNHLSEAYLFRVLSNPNDPLQKFYTNEVTIFTPGTLQTVFCAQFHDVELGSRVFYSIYMIVLLLGMVLLVRHVKSDLWIALLSTLLFYNFSTMFGFCAYTMALSLLLVAVMALLKFNAKPTLTRSLVLSGLVLLLYYCHILVFFFALIVFATIIVFQKDFTRKHLLGIMALVPGLVITFVWISSSSSFQYSTFDFLLYYYREEYLETLAFRLSRIFSIDNPVAAGNAGELFSMAMSVPVFLGLIAGLVMHKSDASGEREVNKARQSAELFLIVAILCYLFAPNRLPEWSYFYERFSVIFFLGTIWVLSFVLPRRVLPLARVCVVILVVVHSVVWYRYFTEFKEVAKPFRTVLYRNPDALGRSLSAVIADQDFRGTSAFIHYQNYQLVWNGGVVPARFLEYRFHLFGRRNPEVVPDYHEWESVSRAGWLVNKYRNVDLILCHGSVALGDTVASKGYALLRRDDEWMLFRKR